MSSTLMPFFRSDGQARLLAVLLLRPEGEPLHVSELARRADVPYATAHREIELLERGGVVTTDRVGRSRVVKANPASPYLDDIRSLVLKGFGPVVVLEPLLANVSGIEEAYVFGSWAARYAGQPGPDPGDVDVLVVGRPKAQAVDEAAEEAERLLGREVQTTIVSENRWRRSDSGFLRTVKSRPLVQVLSKAARSLP